MGGREGSSTPEEVWRRDGRHTGPIGCAPWVVEERGHDSHGAGGRAGWRRLLEEHDMTEATELEVAQPAAAPGR